MPHPVPTLVIIGAHGQLGRALAELPVPKGWERLLLARPEIDVTDPLSVDAALEKVTHGVVVNATAYTAVDKAETDSEQAYAVNRGGARHVALAAARHGLPVIHVSTDFVFDGTAGIPYAPDAAPNPLGVYGRTKLDGERLAGDAALIVRTAWVYAPTGGNFVRTMLRLMAERREVRVVADQIGTPTYAPGLAAALWTLADKGVTGIHHYTDAGAASWYDFAVAIQEEALAAGLLGHAVPVIPIATADFPTPAKRPSYSVLDKTSTFAALGGPTLHWRVNLRTMISKIKTIG